VYEPKTTRSIETRTPPNQQTGINLISICIIMKPVCVKTRWDLIVGSVIAAVRAVTLSELK
jgi:hypothetical protein